MCVAWISYEWTLKIKTLGFTTIYRLGHVLQLTQYYFNYYYYRILHHDIHLLQNSSHYSTTTASHCFPDKKPEVLPASCNALTLSWNGRHIPIIFLRLLGGGHPNCRQENEKKNLLHTCNHLKKQGHLVTFEVSPLKCHWSICFHIDYTICMTEIFYSSDGPFPSNIWKMNLLTPNDSNETFPRNTVMILSDLICFWNMWITEVLY